MYIDASTYEIDNSICIKMIVGVIAWAKVNSWHNLQYAIVINTWEIICLRCKIVKKPFTAKRRNACQAFMLPKWIKFIANFNVDLQISYLKMDQSDQELIIIDII